MKFKALGFSGRGGVFLAVCKQLTAKKKLRSYFQTISWAVVDLIGNPVKFILAVNRQVRALGQVLPHKAIHVFV